MKNLIFVFVISFFVSSCSFNQDSNGQYVLLPIESVEMSNVYYVGSTSEIKIKFRRPTDCHMFNKIHYSSEQQSRIIAIEVVKLNQNNCLPDNESIYEVPLYFKPTTSGIYTFKFWLGVDENNVNQYLIHEVNVLTSNKNQQFEFRATHK